MRLNFVPTPRRIPVKDFVAAVETTTIILDANEADDLRMQTCRILRKAMPPTSNLSKQQKTAISELRQMEGVVILPADKGNATVLMTREEYDGKLEGLLNTDTYKGLKKDPSAAQEARIGHVLREYVKKDEISDGLYDQLRPSGVNHPGSMGSQKSIQKESCSGL